MNVLTISIFSYSVKVGNYLTFNHFENTSLYIVMISFNVYTLETGSLEWRFLNRKYIELVHISLHVYSINNVLTGIFVSIFVRLTDSNPFTSHR